MQNSQPIIDYGQVRQFLAALAPGETRFVFQTFDDRKQNPQLAARIEGTLDNVWQRLERLQAQGAGVFVQVQGGYSRGKDHVTHGRALFADLDDPEDLSTALAQAESELPPPSMVIESSPGKRHLYWFTDDFPAQRIAHGMTEIADVVGADGNIVSNVDRVMRLPGTTHHKGTPAPVRIIQVSPHRYTVDALLQAASTASRRGRRIKTATGSANQTRYDPVFGLPIQESVDEIDQLPAGDRTMKLVAMGGKLVSEGWSYERIEAELRDRAERLRPEGHAPVSEHAWENEILPAVQRFIMKDRGFNPTQAAITPPPAMASVPGVPTMTGPAVTPPPMASSMMPPPSSLPANLNDPAPPDPYAPTVYNDTTQSLDQWLARYVYVEKGKMVVDVTRPMASGVYTLEDFKQSMANCKVGQGLMFNKWIGNPARQTVYSIAFRPGQPQLFKEDSTSHLNSFEMPERITAETFDSSKTDVFFDHMHWLFPDAAAWWRMLHWITMTLQKPEVRIPWAPVLVSKQGTGKSWLFEAIKRMFGGRFCATVETKEVEQSYNAFMGDNVLVWFEEVHSRKKYELIDNFKTIINATQMEINRKFGAKGQSPIFANVAMTSNHDDALAVTFEDMRRYWIYKIYRPRLDKDASKRLYDWLDTDGPEHLRFYLETLDLTGWAFNDAPPLTDAFKRMVRYNMSLIHRALSETLEDRFGVFQLDIGTDQQVETTIALKLDQDRLDKRQKTELHHLLRAYTEEMKPFVFQGKVYRPVVWRNAERWSTKPAFDVVKELDRAKAAAIGHEVRADLKVVNQGANE